jgi:Fungal Zn(2)-Cys(6) binuclear cluster domain
MSEQPSNSAPRLHARVRSTRDCNSCRKRKRKCDGKNPCEECVGYGYDCNFVPPSSRSNAISSRRQEESTRAAGRSDHTELSPSNRTPSSGGADVHWSKSEGRRRQQATEGSHLQDPTSFEANSAMSSSSAMAFARDVGIDLKMTIPPRVHGYAWHIGNRPENPRSAVGRVCELISLQSSLPFFNIYFNEVNTLFGVLIHDDFMKRCTSSWGSGGSGPDFEAIICGVITLGSLFSNSSPCPVELDLIELARRLLVSSLSPTPARQ